MGEFFFPFDSPIGHNSSYQYNGTTFMGFDGRGIIMGRTLRELQWKIENGVEYFNEHWEVITGYVLSLFAVSVGVRLALL